MSATDQGATVPGEPGQEQRRAAVGGLCAFSAFGIWALLPVYLKFLVHVPAAEILAHRILWSVVFVGVGVALFRGGAELMAVARSGRLALRLAVAALLVSLNWIVFMTAVAEGYILECSLGYFINPLVNVLLGVVFLRERLTRVQWAAVGLAAAGIVNLAVQLGVLPWISLTLAFLFGFYGLVRKTAPIGAAGGLLAETLFLVPFALAYLGYRHWIGEGAFMAHGWVTDGLLVMAGLVTAVPLILFAAAAKRLRYATVGFFQYIAPTGQFLLAVLVYGETLTDAHLVTFALIWTALALYSMDMFRRKGRAAA